MSGQNDPNGRPASSAENLWQSNAFAFQHIVNPDVQNSDQKPIESDRQDLGFETGCTGLHLESYSRSRWVFTGSKLYRPYSADLKLYDAKLYPIVISSILSIHVSMISIWRHNLMIASIALASPQWGCAQQIATYQLGSRRLLSSTVAQISDKASFYEDLHFPASYKLVFAPASVADDPHHIPGCVMAAPG